MGAAERTAVIGVTGSTGRLGARVVARLAAQGIALRLLVREPSRAPSVPGTEVVRAEYGEGDQVAAALTGLDTVFMVSAAEHPDRLTQHRTFVDAAARAGVGHLVYTSFLSAAPDATFTLARDHWHTEEHIRASGLAYTFLRDGLYADFAPLLMGPDGVIRGPAGAGKASLVAQDDIADVAVAVLTDPAAHAGAQYDLTGPEAFGLAEVTAMLSQATGRDVRYHDETLEEAYASRAGYGAPDWQLDAWVSTYTAIAAGELAVVTGDVERVSGHPATSLWAVLERTQL